jgi:hypothetical protein
VIILIVRAANLRGTHMTAGSADLATEAYEQLAGALRGGR